jgi:hypothetical protein
MKTDGADIWTMAFSKEFLVSGLVVYHSCVFPEPGPSRVKERERSKMK